MAKARVAFGSHTVTHPQLRDLDWSQVEQEIRESKETLEDKLGTKAKSFSYPFAFPEEDLLFKKCLKSLLINLEYSSAVTTRIGTAKPGDDQLFLRRIPINSDDDIALFWAKLKGEYNWMNTAQYGFKLIRHIWSQKRGTIARQLREEKTTELLVN